MSRFARRSLPALLVAVVLALATVPAQARPLHRNTSSDVYGPMNLSGVIHHLWTGFLSLWGADGPLSDPNGMKR